MANVLHAFLSWTSTEGNDMAPGEAHSWWMTHTPSVYGEAVSATAHPVTGNPLAPSRTLAVEDLRVVGDPSGGRTYLFTVRNVGNFSIPGYGIGFGFIQE
jgi:hypothetical protein